MINSTTRKFCMSALRKRLGFNSNIVKARYYKGGNKGLVLEFHNQVNGSDSGEIDYFEISSNGCDLGSFEEFASSCIKDFDGSLLSDEECLKKSRKMYQHLIRWFSNKERFENFLSQNQLTLKKSINIARVRARACV